MNDAEAKWRALDAQVRLWWDQDRATATEADVANDPTGTLLALPRPYSTAGGAEKAFPEMYGWDTHFINLGMLEHGRTDLVADHLHNHLYMIERYGMVLNGNRSYYLTRSQPPLLADSLSRYYAATGDSDMLAWGAEMIAREYTGYWSAAHHRTAVPLTTNRDLGDPRLRPELAAEAETGLDFTPIYGSDVRRCAPLITNACLVRTGMALAEIHQQLGNPETSKLWVESANERAEAMRGYCWSEDAGFFREYDVVDGRQLEFHSLSAYWTMWAGLATSRQAERMVARLNDFRGAHGVYFTDRVYPSPHAEFQNLQWQRPAGWPPMQVIVVQGLQAYGYDDIAREIAREFVDLQVRIYRESGSLWEKYDVFDGGIELPVERYPAVAMHGWSSASVAVLGSVAYGPTQPAASTSGEPEDARQ